jgi:CHAT domain-containing protein
MTMDSLLDEIRDADDWRLAVASSLPSLVEPNDFLRLLKAEAERHWTLDPRTSLRYSEALVHAARLLEESHHVALGLMAQADSLRYLGRYAESAALFEDAAQAFLTAGDGVGWARTRIGSLVTAHFLGRGAERLVEVDHAHRILVRHSEWLRAAGLDINAGFVCMELGRHARARRLYDRALRLFSRAAAADPTLSELAEVRAAKVTANKAMLLTLLGQSRAALPLHEAALAVFVRRGDVLSVLRQRHNLGQVYLGQAHYGRALRIFGEALADADQAGLDDEAGWIDLDIAECYLRLNRYADALVVADDAVVRFDRCGTPTEAAKARYSWALASSGTGDIGRALAALEQAASVFDMAGMASQSGAVALQRSRLHLAAGNAESAWDESVRAESIFADRSMAVRAAEAQLVRAHAALLLGRDSHARQLANTALRVVRASEARWLDHEGHHVLARVARRRGNLARALREHGGAVAAIERVQSQLPTELRINFLADKLSVYHEAIDCALDDNRPELAFEYLERSKSRALVDFLSSHPEVRLRRRGGSQPLLDELAQLREEHNWAYNRLHRQALSHRPDDEPGEVEAARLRSLVRDQERRIRRLLERLALEDADVFETPDSVPAPAVLDAETVLLEFYVHGDRSLVFILDDQKLTVAPLPITTSLLLQAIRRWQLSLDLAAHTFAARERLDHLERNALGILGLLYDALMRPAASHLTGRKRLCVVPHGPLHGVPFHALHDGSRFVLESMEVSVCPSSGVQRLCTQRPPRPASSALIVASSDAGRLPHVLVEARELASRMPGEVYLEEQATREAVAGAAARHGVLHLAAHGEARLDNPLFAHVKLADGQLSMSDLLSLELDGALVTLSACESGRAVVTGGDELIGLSRALLHAGARTLVQSLWRVEDRSTARLMRHFYRTLRSGHTPAAALREAQLLLLGEHGHPYVWAPFQLLGSGDRSL